MRSAVASIAVLAAACAPVSVHEPPAFPYVAAGAPAANLPDRCVSDYRPGIDYFPHKTRFVRSAQLQVSYHGNWKRVTFTPAVDTRETISMVLVQCGTPHPKVGPKDVVVEVPVRSFATANPSLLGAAVMLGVEDRLRGVPNAAAVSLPSIQARVKEGEVASVYAIGHANGEQAAALGADLFFTFYSAYPDANIHPLLRRLGVDAVPQSDHTEPTPLGRAEWLKYLALFFNKEQEANLAFAVREARYRELAALTRQVRKWPLVQLGYPETRDSWSQAGGSNQLYRMVEDAGGRHAWHDNGNAGSLTFAPMEKLLDRAGNADVWIGNFAPGAPTIEDLRREQARFAWLGPIAKGQVWWFDRGKAGFANPWSDQGMTEPHQALAEMIAILHPELLPEPPEPRFLRRLARERS